MAGKIGGIKSAHFLVMPHGAVKFTGLFFMFSVAFSNKLKLKREKVQGFKFRKKDSRAFRFNFWLFHLQFSMLQMEEREGIVNFTGTVGNLVLAVL